MNVIPIPLTGRERKKANPPAPQVRGVAVVSCKELISAVSGQSHGHMLSSHAADVIRGYDGGITKWLLQRTRQLIDCIFYIRLDKQLVMVRLETLRNQTRVAGFIEVLIGEAD